MKKLLLRASSLLFAVAVTALLVARAAGCTSTRDRGLEPLTPTSTPPATAPTTPGNPGQPSAPPFSAPSAAPDAGSPASNIEPNSPPFMPATKAPPSLFQQGSPGPPQSAPR